MRTLTVCTAALMMILSVVPIAWGQDTGKDKAVPRERAPRPEIDRRAEQGQAAQKLQAQIDALKSANESLVAQLRAISDSARKEKATQTAALVQKLISEQQQALRENMRRLEQEHQQVLRAVKEDAGRSEKVRPNTRRAPDFELSRFEGGTVRLADYKNSIVVLEWINPDCSAVQYHYDKAGTMTALAKKYKDKNVVWLAIDSTDGTSVEANREFAKKHKLASPILDDRSGKVGRLYGAMTTPHLFIIDKGYVVYDGAIDNAPNGTPNDGGQKVNYVDKALSELTSGKPITTPKTQPYGSSVKYPSQIPTEQKTEKAKN